jgi:hypothetical protein
MGIRYGSAFVSTSIPRAASSAKKRSWNAATESRPPILELMKGYADAARRPSAGRPADDLDELVARP